MRSIPIESRLEPRIWSSDWSGHQIQACSSCSGWHAKHQYNRENNLHCFLFSCRNGRWLGNCHTGSRPPWSGSGMDGSTSRQGSGTGDQTTLRRGACWVLHGEPDCGWSDDDSLASSVERPFPIMICNVCSRFVQKPPSDWHLHDSLYALVDPRHMNELELGNWTRWIRWGSWLICY